LLLGLFLCPLNSYAQNLCFDDEASSRMIVTIERANICEQQLTATSESNAELQRQVDLKEETIRLQAEQITLYKSMDEMKATISAAKDTVCKEQIKAASPTFWQNMGKYATGGVIGAVLAVAAMLIL
jgi:uncharacterized protein YlxW (UPF0749 family)